jgi:hypothetical protein
MQVKLFIPLVAAVALMVGCGSDDAAPVNPGPYVPGFNPPPPNPGELTFVTPVFKNLTPGTDITMCSYLDQHFDTESDVTNFRVYQAAPGHHMVVYAAKKPQPVGSHPCTDDDMVNSRYVAAGGSDYSSEAALFVIPPGLAFRIDAGAQVMIQTHWLNATDQTYDGQGVAYLSTAPASPSKQVLGLFNILTTNIVVPAGDSATATTTCKIKHDVTLFTLTGHAHQWGKRIEIQVQDDTTTNMLWAHDWVAEFQSNPPMNVYSVEQPLRLAAGQTVQLTCTWQNTTAKDIRFPTEMCVATGFYFPGAGEIDCEDGEWSE